MDEDLEGRVRRAVEQFLPRLQARALRLDIVEVAGGMAHLRLHSRGDAASLAQLLATLPRDIEKAILAEAPDLEDVVIEALHEPRALDPVAGAVSPPALAVE